MTVGTDDWSCSCRPTCGCRSAVSDDGGSGEGAGGRSQRPVAGARNGCSSCSRSVNIPLNMVIRATEPRWNQAGRRDDLGARSRFAAGAAQLRNRQRPLVAVPVDGLSRNAR